MNRESSAKYLAVMHKRSVLVRTRESVLVYRLQVAPSRPCSYRKKLVACCWCRDTGQRSQVQVQNLYNQTEAREGPTASSKTHDGFHVSGSLEQC